MSTDWILLANQNHKRAQLFRSALQKKIPQAQIYNVDWQNFLTQKISLHDFPDQPTFFRIETPAQDFEVEKLILGLGEPIGDISKKALESLPYQKGEVLFPRQWFCGFTALMEQIHHVFLEKKHWFWMQTPQEILRLFDKRKTSAYWQKNGLPVPSPCFPNSGKELLSWMREKRHKQVFVKLAYGSSASGILCIFQGPLYFYGWTTLQKCQGHLFNSRRLEKLRDRELEQTIDYLLLQGAQVEVGIPKATLDGVPFDLRILMVNGKPAHRIVRQSDKPMTNLHLGGKRGSWEDFTKTFSFTLQEKLLTDCTRLAALHQCFHLGLDVVLHQNQEQYFFLEGNAFGDLFPELLYQNCSTYEWEILEWIQKDDN